MYKPLSLVSEKLSQRLRGDSHEHKDHLIIMSDLCIFLSEVHILLDELAGDDKNNNSLLFSLLISTGRWGEAKACFEHVVNRERNLSDAFQMLVSVKTGGLFFSSSEEQRIYIRELTKLVSDQDNKGLIESKLESISLV
ncbi:MAG: hypothetical protein AAGC79_13115 [Pseudomonadota bacterium]